jgi:hypothetical protein
MMPLTFDGSGATGRIQDLESLLGEHAPHVPPEFVDNLMVLLEGLTEVPHFDEEPTIGTSEIVYRLQLPQGLHDAIATLRACDWELGGHHSCHDLLNRDARIIADYPTLVKD